VQVNDGSANTVAAQHNRQRHRRLVEFYLSDHLRLGRYVTLLGGERFSIYRAGSNESATIPASAQPLNSPLHWVLRGFYGHFFQPAPMLTVSSSVLNYAGSLPGGENTFTPLPSERDEEHQFGIQIPYKGWLLDVDTTFKNRVNNFLDHSNLGESNMYFPIAVDGALVRAWEMTLRSPRWPLRAVPPDLLEPDRRAARQHHRRLYLQHSHRPGLRPRAQLHSLDHDQREHAQHRLHGQPARCTPGSPPMSTTAPASPTAWPAQTRAPTTAPICPCTPPSTSPPATRSASAGSSPSTVINVTNHRVLLDNSITIGGFHYNDPRMFSAELRYRFHFSSRR
jgi:hypothetical protein